MVAVVLKSSNSLEKLSRELSLTLSVEQANFKLKMLVQLLQLFALPLQLLALLLQAFALLFQLFVLLFHQENI